MNDVAERDPLKIKKYANRRFYDTSRSCHVTLRAMHDLICAGHELCITDGTTGRDITNMVLTQIILERDPPKLDIFPANVLHQVIRTQREYLGSVVEQFLTQAFDAQKASQQQWQRFVRNTLGVDLTKLVPDPMQWTRSLMDSFATPKAEPRTGGRGAARTEVRGSADGEIESLRRQLEELNRQVAALRAAGSESSDS